YEITSITSLQLTGNIPECVANLSYLRVLDLQMNRFDGTFLSDFSKDCDLHVLNLNGNQIEGYLPISLSHCKMLEFLNLGSNKIEDRFPAWLQTLPNLKVLILRDNNLHGGIANLKIKHPFPSLVIFDISGNNFSGPLPKAYFKNFKAMKIVTQVGQNISRLYIMDSEGSYDSVTVMNKGINMKLVKIPINFVTIDLARNKFEGEIPNVIGELHTLKGPILQSIRTLTNLESLDLSSNMLTGVIPVELTNLDFLEFLNLSNNNLVGEIPHGKHFNTFSNDSFEGNSGLCGFPLSKKCGPELEPRHFPASTKNFWSEEKFGFGWKAVAIGYGCGFVIGIG
ncbi:receptor-like protein kinase, partial [Trifolium pratense]